MTPKHIFLGSGKSWFLYLFIEQIVSFFDKQRLNEILFVDIEKNIEFSFNFSHFGIQTITLENLLRSKENWNISESKTLTLMSFDQNNAKSLSQLVSIWGEQLLHNVYIHLCENEISRWVQLLKNGKLEASLKYQIDDNLIYLLGKIKNFILAKEPLLPDLCQVLGKNKEDINYFDARDCFLSISKKTYETMSLLFNTDPYYERVVEKKVVFGTKRDVFSPFFIIKVLNSLKKKKKILDFSYVVFTYKKNKWIRIVLDCYCLWLRHLCKKNIDISYPVYTENILLYNLNLWSASDIIVQKRGGMSSVRTYFLINNIKTKVHVQKDSRDEKELSINEQFKVYSFSDVNELTNNLNDDYSSTKFNNEQANTVFRKKLEILKRIYY